MKSLKSVLMVACSLALIVCLSPTARGDVIVSVTPVSDPGYPVPSLWICEWVELSTQECDTSWIVHADEDIFDLHFGSWDSDEMLAPGNTPFTAWSNTCTMAEFGGPPGGPSQQYWQTLDLWGGVMPFCTYWEISISHKPELDGVIQNLWVHPTPEPASLVLLGLGAIALVAKRRA